MTLPDSLSLGWNDADAATWDRLLCAAGKSPLEQSWGYGEATAAWYRQTVDRAVIRRDGMPVAMVQMVRKRMMGIASVVRIVRGPLWLARTEDEATRVAVYRAVRNACSLRRREVLFWSPELPDVPQSHALMRAAGTRRMVTGLSTAWLDLTPDLDALRAGLDGRWRNALNGAEKADTTVRLSTGRDRVAALMADYDAFRRRKRFVGPPGGFVAAIAAGSHGRRVTVLSALAGGDVIAGVVLIRHGTCATYFVSWTSEEGRRRRAHNLLLWRGIEELKKAGVAALDLGGLNTASAAGIARFKLGLKPELVTLAGTFL